MKHSEKAECLRNNCGKNDITEAEMRYEQPKLVSFDNDTRTTTGACGTGSGDSGNCGLGNSAGGISCVDGSENAMVCDTGTCPNTICVGGSGIGAC